jgi:hypothetical protein
LLAPGPEHEETFCVLHNGKHHFTMEAIFRDYLVTTGRILGAFIKR